MSEWALNFLAYGIGTGIFLVCLAWSIRIISEVRTRNQLMRDMAPKGEEPTNEFERRLQDLRGTRFGRPMVAPVPQQREIPRRVVRRTVVPFPGTKKDDE